MIAPALNFPSRPAQECHSCGIINAFLAEGAARERDARVKHYPAMVGRGEMTAEEAGADLAAWHAIAALFGDGAAETALAWTDIEAAAARALQRRAAALAVSPADRSLQERHTVVAAVHDRIVWHAQLVARSGPSGERKEAA